MPRLAGDFLFCWTAMLLSLSEFCWVHVVVCAQARLTRVARIARPDGAARTAPQAPARLPPAPADRAARSRARLRARFRRRGARLRLDRARAAPAHAPRPASGI